ncbi:NDP-sugar synthase [bacterium]|nr:NDP-sugar synthase [bacterium]
MKAFILCAGYGNRLKPYSDLKPKPLFPVLNKPVLGHILDHLEHHGIRSFALNTHHLGKQIESYVNSLKKRTCEFQIYPENPILGTGGGIKNIRDFVFGQDSFLVHNGDVINDIDLDAVIRFHQRHQPLATLVLTHSPAFNTVYFDTENRIVAIGGASKENKSSINNLTFTGIIVINTAIFELFPDKTAFPITDFYLKALSEMPGQLMAYIHRGYWADTGTPESYLKLHRDILVNNSITLPSSPAIHNNLYSGDNVNFAANVKLEGYNSIGRDCRIGEGVHLENCVMWPGSRALEGTTHRNEIIVG